MVGWRFEWGQHPGVRRIKERGRANKSGRGLSLRGEHLRRYTRNKCSNQPPGNRAAGMCPQHVSRSSETRRSPAKSWRPPAIAPLESPQTTTKATGIATATRQVKFRAHLTPSLDAKLASLRSRHLPPGRWSGRLGHRRRRRCARMLRDVSDAAAIGARKLSWHHCCARGYLRARQKGHRRCVWRDRRI